jgi:hypothetical protein
MDDAATMHKDSDGSSGLSLLDVVTHATRTVIEAFGPLRPVGHCQVRRQFEIVLP